MVLLQVSLSPAQRGQLTRAAPRVVGEGEVGDGAELEAFGERPQLVVVQMQRLDRRHASKRSVRELWGKKGRGVHELLLWFFWELAAIIQTFQSHTPVAASCHNSCWPSHR